MVMSPPPPPSPPRVSIPQSILDPPHRYRIHRRKSFDASDMLSLPRVSSHRESGWAWVRGWPRSPDGAQRGPGPVPRPPSKAELEEDGHPDLWSPGQATSITGLCLFGGVGHLTLAPHPEGSATCWCKWASCISSRVGARS